MHPSVARLVRGGLLVAAAALSPAQGSPAQGSPAQGPTFHVAADGDDSRSGLSPSLAWRSLQRVDLGLQSGEIQTGARVLFRAGDTFRGGVRLLPASTNGVEFASYGSGQRPRLSGARLLASWLPLGGDKWVAACPARAEFVFRDGQRLRLARTPDQGAFYTDSCTTNALTSAAISGLPLANGTLVLRNFDWSFVRLPVSSHSGSSLTFAPLVEDPGPGRNFYIEGTAALLDAPGEWWQDPQSLVVVLQLAPGEQPTAATFEAVVDDGGIVGDWNRQNVRIQGLEFVHYASYAVQLRGSGCIGNQIRDCSVRDSGGGVSVQGPDVVVDGNQLRDLCRDGVYGYEFGPNSSVRGNLVERVCLDFGVAAASATGEFLVDGLDIDSRPGTVVADNVLRDLGYNGIRIDGTGGLVEHNHVVDVLRLYTDGGGIYSFGTGTGNLVIRENVVERVHGVADGARYVGGVGIYLDNFTDNCRVERNVCVDAFSNGFTINAGATNHRLLDNIAWGSGHGAVLSNWLPQPVLGNRLEGNLLYTLAEASFPLVLQSTNGWFQMATYERNRYFQPYGPYTVLASAYTSYPCYTLTGWRAQNPGNDLLSREHFVRIPARTATRTTGPEQLQNGAFTNGIAGWTSWGGSGSTATANWVQLPEFGGGAMQFDVAGSGYTVVYQAGFTVQQGQWYRVRCRLKAPAPIDVHLELQRHYGDYAILAPIRWLPVDEKLRDHEFCWRSPVGDGPVRLNFRLDRPGRIWIDDVSLQPVAVRNDPARQRSPIFVNPSAVARTFALAGRHRDMDGQPVGNSITVPPWSARVLVRDE
jgi:hypothetical protein